VTGDLVSATGVLVAVGAASAGASWLVMRELRRRAILDRPNDRSSHTVPVPRGGGLAVTPILLVAWAGVGWALGAGWPFATALAAAAFLAFVSWQDDLRSLSPGLRFGAQIVAVAAALALLPAEAPIFQGWLPFWADRVLAGLAWLWFVNLFNFMDGIDGISGTEMATIGLGLAAAALLTPALGLGPPDGLSLYGAALAGAGLGFLALNWHPARIFLGDVGSVPIGFLAGWLLLYAAAGGLWLPALVLPAYYLADATLTLLRRGLRGEKVWRAHREHFYQRAAAAGLSHAQVMHGIALGNAALVACALAGLWVGAWALLPAAAAVLALLAWLATRGAA
jgi:UDP-N-acetylmuramyl pentapeptide phosphotransferase/UDP-N-acetylglucosamine-1-phosphate transferase